MCVFMVDTNTKKKKRDNFLLRQSGHVNLSFWPRNIQNGHNSFSLIEYKGTGSDNNENSGESWDNDKGGAAIKLGGGEVKEGD